MSTVYLVASLPTLELGDTPPYSVEDFVFHCTGALTAEELAELRCVAEGRPEEGTTDFAQRWAGVETQLRNAVAKERATKTNADARGVLRMHSGYEVAVDQAVHAAFAKPNPLEMEWTLDQARWQMLEELALQDAFGLSPVLAYAVKLKLTARWAALEDEKGREHIEQFIDEQVEAGTVPAGTAE